MWMDPMGNLPLVTVVRRQTYRLQSTYVVYVVLVIHN